MFALLLFVALAASARAKKVEIVSVTGCLREQGTNWMLVAATEPVPSVANQAQAEGHSERRRRRGRIRSG